MCGSGSESNGKAEPETILMPNASGTATVRVANPNYKGEHKSASQRRNERLQAKARGE